MHRPFKLLNFYVHPSFAVSEINASIQGSHHGRGCGRHSRLKLGAIVEMGDQALQYDSCMGSAFSSAARDGGKLAEFHCNQGHAA
jgi:hypothetical protein